MSKSEDVRVLLTSRKSMCPSVTVESTDEISEESCVCHYDELDRRAKERFPQLAGSADVSVSEPIADGLSGCDVVKYTDYYAVTLFAENR